MSHDTAHCYEWHKGCPDSCFRARLTAELNREPWVHLYPVPWGHFAGTEECRLKEDKDESKT